MTLFILCIILFLVGLYGVLTKRNLIKIIINIFINQFSTGFLVDNTCDRTVRVQFDTIKTIFQKIRNLYKKGNIKKICKRITKYKYNKQRWFE